MKKTASRNVSITHLRRQLDNLDQRIVSLQQQAELVRSKLASEMSAHQHFDIGLTEVITRGVRSWEDRVLDGIMTIPGD